MLHFKKSILTFIILGCVLANASAQHTFNFDNISKLDKFQDSLTSIGNSMQEATNNIQRFDQNAKFIKTLVSALKINGSFYYGFDSVKYFSAIKSPDKSFRIFSWAVPEDDGTYHFFGSIQISTNDGSLKLFPLIDATTELTNTNEITSNKKWFGSRYYEIIPIVNSGKQTYYALLGWKGNTNKTSKKIIEILSFNKGEPVFGKSVFEGLKNTPVKNRIIFEYNKLNSMTLRLDKKIGMIVFDHLVPFSPDMVGNFEFYASDSSFDAYRPIGGKLKLTENIEVNNDPDAKDELYIDPKTKDIPIQKKF